MNKKMHTISLDSLQVGMAFTTPVFSKKNKILLPEFYPIYPEFLIEWQSKKMEFVLTTGEMVTDQSLFRPTLPGYISIELREMIQHYHNSVMIIKEQFSNIHMINLDKLQSLASSWIGYISNGHKSEIFLKIIRYANSKEKDYFYTHILDVMLISIGIYLKYTPEYSLINLMQIAIGSLLYDIGMLKLPESFREYSVVFSPIEKQQLQQHTIVGYNFLIDELQIPNILALPALEHHERPDGSGYPRKMKEHQIHKNSMIIALADILTAQIHHRSFKDRREPVEILKDFIETTLSIFVEDSEKFMNAFITFMTIYPVTSFLKLNTEEFVVVIETNQHDLLRPIVMVIHNKDGSYNMNHNVINLSEDINSHILIEGVYGKEHLESLPNIHIIPVLNKNITEDSNPNSYYINAHKKTSAH